MRSVSFQELITATGGEDRGLISPSDCFDRVVLDSRMVEPGDLFWAVAGERYDGHQFVAQALAAGAVGSVVDEHHVDQTAGPRVVVDDTLLALWDFSESYRNHTDALVIGVTGSVGKTTTRRMISSVLSAKFTGTESPRNYNNQFGVPLSLLEIDPADEFAVIELGASRVGDIDELCGIAHPEVGVVTAIGPAHLEDFESFENIVQAKSELIAALPEHGFAVLNGDDKNVLRLAEIAPCPVILVGEKKHNDIIARNVSCDNNSISFEVDGSRFSIPAAGRHHLVSALCAIAIGRQIDMDDAEIATGMQTFKSVAGRTQLMNIGPWTVINDSYNSNPLSMSSACKTLRDWKTDGKKILVTGDMLSLGEWSKNFHELIGSEAVQCRLDRIVAVGSQAGLVVGNAKKNGMDAGRLGVCSDHDLALLHLDMWLEPGDVVLVKGSRDMHMERIVAGLEELAAAQQPAQQSQKQAA